MDEIQKDRAAPWVRRITIKVDGGALVEVTLRARTREHLEAWFCEKPWNEMLWAADTDPAVPAGPPDRIEMELSSDGNNWRGGYFYDETKPPGCPEKIADIVVGTVPRRRSVVVLGD